jgi:hypothetical protein
MRGGNPDDNQRAEPASKFRVRLVDNGEPESDPDETDDRINREPFSACPTS